MGLIGLVAEVVVLGACAAAVVTNVLLLRSCDLLELKSFGNTGSLGLHEFNPPTGNGDECIAIDDSEVDIRDAAFNCAHVCAVIALCAGAILFVFGLFQQCIFPLPCSQRLMDLSSTVVQICLGLVYVIWLTDACDIYSCTYGEGGTLLIITQLLWLGAGCFARCMRPGRFERRDEIKANKEKKAEEKKRKAAEDELANKELELAEREKAMESGADGNDEA